ncbi:thioredoxin family protein [Nocardioides sp. TF02-7]|uniref:thioredoxin family protein n=1 Tax=Nocardioides sp. TF02-7 TaxID=2917724 RepID=UPI001F06CA08|nr:thioredoxin family protein [Nocardioides sp. TF02-7]UMG91139.1 thioredoxin family protein [Nocardioides sp. TF02-7]
MTGILVLVVAVVAALGFGLHRRLTDGDFAAPADEAPTTWTRLQAAVPDARRGERATLVQFSSAFCAPCRATRVVLADVARREPGVEHVEVDAEQHLELVRALDVRRTPTTLVLDGAGAEVGRAAGAPRREQVLAALPPEPAR